MEPIALITGANRGLGLCLVKQALTRGYTVFAASRHPEDANLKALANEFPACHLLFLDVTDSDSCRSMAEEIARTAPHLDLVINNAAIEPKSGKLPLEETDLDELPAVFDVNSIGPLRVVKACLSLLKQSPMPTIANISSEAGSISTNWRKAEYGYCMSKAALNRATVTLKEAFGEQGFTVLALHPGWLRTDMGGQDAVHDPMENAGWLLSHIEDAVQNPDAPVYQDFDGSPFPW